MSVCSVPLPTRGAMPLLSGLSRRRRVPTAPCQPRLRPSAVPTPTPAVVVLSQHADEGYIVELISEGAEGLGYLLKERVGDREQLTNALRETSRGGSVIDPTLVDALMRRRHLDKRSRLDVLTARANSPYSGRWQG